MPISALSHAATNPEAAASSLSSSQPAWEATPVPSADTFILAQRGLRLFTYQVPSCEGSRGLQQSHFPLQDGHFGG